MRAAGRPAGGAARRGPRKARLEARSEDREVHPRRVEDALRGRLGVVDAEDVERLLRQQRADEAEEEHARRREDGAALRAADRACVFDR